MLLSMKLLTLPRSGEVGEGTKVMADIDLEKMRTIGHLRGGRSGDKVLEYRDPDDGHRIKEVKNELGSKIEHNTKDDRVDAVITPQTVHMHASEIGMGELWPGLLALVKAAFTLTRLWRC